jgi:voltage-gated potassium channel
LNIGPDRPLGPFLRRLALLGLLILGIVALGTVGFVVIEGNSVWDGFFRTFDTIATVGSIPAPTSTAGELLTVALIVLGVGTLFYALVTVTEFFVAGHLGELLQERRTLRMIDSMRDHHVICGFGRVGRQVAHDLRAAEHRFVVVDSNPTNREHAEAVGAPFLEGSPSADEMLQRAGLEHARSVLACVDSDAENIFICLSVRELREDVLLVARASVEDSEKKLKRAGADRVISPYKASGSEMARLTLHPQVAGVVDVGASYRMEEIEVTPGCAAVGGRIGDLRGSSLIVALRRPDGAVEPQPAAETVLKEGEVLIVAGNTQAMERLEDLFAPVGDVAKATSA